MLLNPFFQKTFTNDIYIIEALNNGFLINIDCSGLEVLDFEFSAKDIIPTANDTCIFALYSKFDSSTYFLDCSDDECMLLVNLNSKTVNRIVNFEEIPKLMPGVYSWKEELILSSTQGDFFILNQENYKLQRINLSMISLKDAHFLQFYHTSQSYSIVRYYPHNYSFIYKDYHKNILGFFSTLDGINKVLSYPELQKQNNTRPYPNFFDAQYIDDGIFVVTYENKIEIINENNTALIRCAQNEYFKTALPFKRKGEKFLLVLRSNKGTPRKSILEQYKVPNF